MEDTKAIKVRTMAELATENKQAEYLFWVGSAGSYDDRAKKITRAFTKILSYCEIDFAILGIEESDSGDLARRAGNEEFDKPDKPASAKTIHASMTASVAKAKKPESCTSTEHKKDNGEFPPEKKRRNNDIFAYFSKKQK